LAGGAVLPFLSVILGSLGGGSDTDLDISADTDIDIDAMLDTGPDITADTSIDADTGGIAAGDELGSNFGVGGQLSPEIGSAFTIGFLPTSLMALSALAITFGAVGSIMLLTGKEKLITFIVSVIAGYLASVIVQSIIKTLKNIQKRNYGINENELLMYEGKVIDTILPGQLGTVSFTTLKDVHVSYPARCVEGSCKLTPGRIVKVLEIKNGVVTVEPKNKYE
jgi:hypothetical protein